MSLIRTDYGPSAPPQTSTEPPPPQVSQASTGTSQPQASPLHAQHSTEAAPQPTADALPKTQRSVTTPPQASMGPSPQIHAAPTQAPVTFTAQSASLSNPQSQNGVRRQFKAPPPGEAFAGALR